MKIKFLYLFLASFWFLGTSVLGRNWHPFPFKVAYYGKKVVSPGLAWLNTPTKVARLVDALYLDSIQGNQRLRSQLFPAPNVFGGASFPTDMPFLGSLQVTTSADSQTVTCSGWPSCYSIVGQYDLGAIRVGSNPHGSVLEMGVKTILGVPDSVATVRYGADTLWWSKNFGICRVIDMDDIELVGVKDLNLGWHDSTFRLRLPTPGDEIHLWKRAAGEVVCSSSWGNFTTSEYENKLLRIKVVAADEYSIQASVIESQPGASTGITYGASFNYFSDSWSVNATLGDSVLPAGTSRYSGGDNKVTYLGFIDPEGINSKLALVEYIDVPNVFVFLHCARMPMSLYNPYFAVMNTMFCTGRIERLQYPQFINIQGGCSYGTPHSDVQITETKDKTKEVNFITVIPQPAHDVLRFEEVPAGSYEVWDTNGKRLLRGILDGGSVSVSTLPPGLYLFKIFAEGKRSITGKLMID